MLIEPLIELLFFFGILYLIFGKKKSIQKLISKEVNKWVESNIITQKQASKILDSYPKNKIYQNKKERYIRIILFIGALLIGIGMLSFIASNWNYISPWTRFWIVISGMILLYCLGYYFYFLKKKQNNILGIALIMSANISFGGAIFLIAQIFNLSSHYPNAFLIWFVMTLPFLLIFKNKLFFFLNIVLSILWLGTETEYYTFLFTHPGKYILFTIFLFFSMILLLSMIFKKRIKNISIDKVYYLSQIGVLGNIIIARIIFPENGFSDIGLPLHTNIICILSLLLIIYLWLRDKSKTNASQLMWLMLSTVSFFSIFYYPNIWNKWVYIIIFEFITWIGFFAFQMLSGKRLINRIALIGLWSLYSISSISTIFNTEVSGVFIILTILLWSMTTYYLSTIINNKSKETLYIFGIFGLFGSIFLLTFNNVILHNTTNYITTIIKAFIQLIFPISVIFYKRFNKKDSTDSLVLNYIWIITIILTSITLFIVPSYDIKEIIIFIWNIIFLVLVFTMMYEGFQKEKNSIVNLSLAAFSIWLIFRYFDIFWKLLDKSVFFIGGGIILLICGILFQKRNTLLQNNNKTIK